MQCSCLSDNPEGYPKIVENPQLKAVQKYHTAVFTCRATAEGQDQPNIYWLKDFKPVDTNDPRIKMFEDGIFYLTFILLFYLGGQFFMFVEP